MLLPDVLTIDHAPLLGGITLVQARFVTRATPRHTHRELEIGLVLSGRRLVKCRGRETPAKAGSILVFLPGEVHSGAPLDRSGSVYRGFLVSQESLAAGPDRSRGAPEQALWFESPVVRDDDLCRRFSRIHRRMVAGASGHPVEGDFLGAVAALTERHRGRPPREPEARAVHRAAITVRAYLEEHYAARIRLDMLARISGVSIYHLIRVFRAATGLSPYAYLGQVRVHRAEQMLHDGLPVSEVACLTGFADQSHLTRLFKRLTGLPPGQYQRAALGGRVMGSVVRTRGGSIREAACRAHRAPRARPVPLRG